jgi:hypothetical protein
MKTSQFFKPLIACVMTLFIASCGGDGGGGTQTAGGGTGGTGISAGSVSQFGSIFVNGVEFNTNSATYTRDDVSFPHTQPDSAFLKLGMTVEVQGTISSSTTGTANTVKVQEIVRGKLESKSSSTQPATLVVMGQTVRVDDTTAIDSASTSLNAMSVGDLLEVHGKRSSDGGILASYIEGKTAPVTLTVRGLVSAHNSTTHTFVVGALNNAGGLTVDYGTNSAVFNNMSAPATNSWNGQFVSVRGNCTPNPCVLFAATKVEPTGLSLSGATQAELEGFVTTLTSVSDFTVDAQRVLTTGSTIYSGGIASDILTGTKLEVEGSLSAGVITATKIRFKDSVVIDANVTVGISGATLTLDGLPGVTVTANAFSDLSNAGGATVSTLASVLNGRSVRIRGRATGIGSVLATRIQDHGPANTTGNMSLLANVSSSDVNAGAFTLTLLAVPVDTNGLNPNADFKDVTGATITRANFFNALTLNGGLVMATHQLRAPPSPANAFTAAELKQIQLGDSN